MSDFFLTPDEMKRLTGVKVGRNGKTCWQRQIEFLRTTHIPFLINVRGEPVVTRSAVEGRKVEVAKPEKQGWEPKVLTSKKPEKQGWEPKTLRQA